MSNFSCLCADTTLWDPATKAAWGALDFCPTITWFQVHTITYTQLSALFQIGASGEAEKPRQDMAFLMIVPSANAMGNQLFGLAAVWAYPHKGHLTTLVKATQKIMLLANNSPDWLYAFVHMSDTVLHAPLSDNRHVSAMTDGIHTVNTCGQLHQLEVWKLLQHGNSVVFLERLNEEPKAHQFPFQELPL